MHDISGEAMQLFLFNNFHTFKKKKKSVSFKTIWDSAYVKLVIQNSDDEGIFDVLFCKGSETGYAVSAQVVIQLDFPWLHKAYPFFR